MLAHLTNSQIILMTNDLDKKYIDGIEVPEEYPKILEALTFGKTDRLNLYYGGPIHRESDGLRWVRPLVLFDEEKKIEASFHLIYVNFDPTTDVNIVPKLIPFVTCETGIKAGDSNCDCSIRLQELINSSNGQPIAILRRSFVSNPAFPFITTHVTPNQEDEARYFDEAIKELSLTGMTFDLDYRHFNLNLPCVFNRDTVFLENDELRLIGPRIIQNEVGQFFSYSVEFKTDIWENYEIISGTPIRIGEADDLIIRFDSGCDSGQLYDDSACDCLDQFRAAMAEIKKEGRGLIIHIPSHDGRGYGMAGKMETELYKVGKPGLVNQPDSPMDTVSAARLLYGDNFDIRTYEGAAKILLALGLKTVRIYTDNSQKFKAIKAHGIEVIRVKTNTHKESAQEHIDAKHRTPPYNDEAWLES